MNSKKPKISVIVCTYNRAKKLGPCLTALQNQSLPQDDYEIIVVNDGSKDDTLKVLKDYNLRIVTNNPNQGLAQSRNNGVKAARADILAFTDDDCISDKNWLESLLGAYDDQTVDAVGGKIVPYQTNHWLLKYYEINNPLAHLPADFANSPSFMHRFAQYLKRLFELGTLSEDDKDLCMIVGANMSMRRSAFETACGFDGSRRNADDEIFWKKLKVARPDARLVYQQNAIIQHAFDSSFKDALWRNQKYGRGRALMFMQGEDQVPAVYPFPILVATSLLLALVNPYLLLTPPLLTLLLYPGWLIYSVRKLRPQYLLYSFVQLSLEAAVTSGFIRSYLNIGSRREVRD